MSFPGILGRTCDRPCEPACRRARVEEGGDRKGKPEPVAICRLKRVAADYKDDIRDRLPQPALDKERQADRARRRRAGVADGRPRSGAARLRMHRVRRRHSRRRDDPQPDPALPVARIGDRRGSGLHPRPGRRVPARQANRQPQGTARGTVRRGFHRLRRAARARHRRAGARAKPPRTSTSASTGSRTCRSAT